MTAQFNRPRKFVAIVIAGLAIGLTAWADDGSGLEIQGTEELHNLVVLSATTNAPAGAAGVILIEAHDQGSTAVAQMNLQLQALLPDVYSVSITKKTDSNLAVVVGSINVGPTNATTIILPKTLSPLDIATITVASTNGVTLLTGDLADGSSVLTGLFKAKVPVVGGAAAPGASGLAYTKSKTINGVRTTRFKLFAKGAVPNATLTLKINGVEYGTVSTDPHGNLKLQSLPDDLDPESIQWMEFDDPDGTNELSVTF